MTQSGRWPANVILSPGAAEVLDGQSGDLTGRGNRGGTRATGMGYHGGTRTERLDPGNYGDSGGASRFFLNTGYEQWELEWILANGLRPCGE